MIDATGFHHGLKPGDIVLGADGEEYTVVYWFLDGVGGIPGRVSVEGVSDADLPPPQVMFREPYRGADLPCIGKMVERLEK